MQCGFRSKPGCVILWRHAWLELYLFGLVVSQSGGANAGFYHRDEQHFDRDCADPAVAGHHCSWTGHWPGDGCRRLGILCHPKLLQRRQDIFKPNLQALPLPRHTQTPHTHTTCVIIMIMYVLCNVHCTTVSLYCYMLLLIIDGCYNFGYVSIMKALCTVYCAPPPSRRRDHHHHIHFYTHVRIHIHNHNIYTTTNNPPPPQCHDGILFLLYSTSCVCTMYDGSGRDLHQHASTFADQHLYTYPWQPLLDPSLSLLPI